MRESSRSSSSGSGVSEDPRYGLLRGASRPREVLARISAGDPLGLRALGRRAARARAVFCDGDRLHLRSLAVCARRAVLDPPASRAALDGWLDAAVEAALTDLLDEEAERLFLAEDLAEDGADGPALVREAAASAAPSSDAFELLGRPLGLDPAHLRRACARFNALAPELRRAFQRFVLDGEPLSDCVEREGARAHRAARAARAALLLFLGHDGADSSGTASTKDGKP